MHYIALVTFIIYRTHFLGSVAIWLEEISTWLIVFDGDVLV